MNKLNANYILAMKAMSYSLIAFFLFSLVSASPQYNNVQSSISTKGGDIYYQNVTNYYINATYNITNNLTNFYNSTYATWLPNYTASSKYWYNMTYSGSTYNSTYALYAYNQTYSGSTFNSTYALYAYNQSIYPITYLNTTYGKFWYNMTTSSTGSSFNSTYNTWAYNQTIPADAYCDARFNAFTNPVFSSVTLYDFNGSINIRTGPIANPAMSIETGDASLDILLNPASGTTWIESDLLPYPTTTQDLGSADYKFNNIYSSSATFDSLLGAPNINLTNSFGLSNSKYLYNQTCTGKTLWNWTQCYSNGVQVANCYTNVPSGYLYKATAEGFHNGTTTFAYINLIANGVIRRITSAERAAATNPTPYIVTYFNSTTTGVLNITMECRNKTLTGLNGRMNEMMINIEVYKPC